MQRLKKAICIHRHYRKTMAELARLTNQELNDLGLIRKDIPSVARTAAFKVCVN